MSWDVKANITADDRELSYKLKSAEQQVQATSQNMAGHFKAALGGDFFSNLITRGLQMAGLGIFADIGKQFADGFSSKIKDIRLGTTRTGLDSDTFQRTRNLSEATDISGEAFPHYFDRVAEAQEKVKAGGEAGAKAMKEFGLLGVNAADVQTKSFQELGLQLFKNLQTMDITGDKLVALKAIGGRSGPELIPAAKMGLDSAAAEKGMVSDQDIKDAADRKKAMAGSNAINADMANSAGKFFGVLFDAIKSIPSVFNTDSYKSESTEDYYARQKQADDQKTINDKDEARRARQAEIDQQNAAAEGQASAERDQAQKGLPQLQKEFDAKEAKNKLAEMSPTERRAELQSQLEEEQKLRDASKAQYGETQDVRDQGRYLQHGARAFDLEQEIRQFDKTDKLKDSDYVKDSLSRIGGGFLSPDRQVPTLLTEIRDTLQKLESHAANAPMDEEDF